MKEQNLGTAGACLLAEFMHNHTLANFMKGEVIQALLKAL
jgi:hypothetical protein